jgi:heme ABC exporter ATP-binding subunit CcmA
VTAPLRADIALEGVQRRFGALRALVDVDLHLPAGSFVALMGGNGAGKSTLLRVMAGLAAPTAGIVRIAGVDVRRAGPRLRAQLGYLGHASMLYGDLTVRENLAFHAALYRLPADAVEAAAMRFDIAHALDRPVRVLSRGNTQRAALARALLHQPSILLLDEPFTGLDLESAEGLVGHLDGLHTAGHTIVMSVHEATRAVHADRLVVLAAGRVVADTVADDPERITALVLDAQRRRTAAAAAAAGATTATPREAEAAAGGAEAAGAPPPSPQPDRDAEVVR